MALEWILTVFRLVLAALFTFSGVIKLFDLRGFSIIVAKFGMMPRQLVKPFAYTLPFVEAVVGLWLLSNWMLFWSAIAAAGLMVTSQIGVLGALIQKKKIESCGCYGTAIKVPVTWRKFFENCVWLAIALVLVWGTF
jgi:uncharacterized membrane protein YphA (DoxX/SURF4 family)